MNNVLFRRGDQTFIDENVPLNDGQIIFNETDEAIYVDTLINNVVTRKRYGGGNLSRSDIDMTLSTTSENPVANKVLTELMLQKADVIDDLGTALAVTENGVPTGCKTIQGLNTNINIVQAQVSNSGDMYDSTRPYEVGDFCIYNNVLYRCTTACSAGSWATNQSCFTQDTLTSVANASSKYLDGTNDIVYETTGVPTSDRQYIKLNKVGKTCMLRCAGIHNNAAVWATSFTLPQGFRPKDSIYNLALKDDSSCCGVYIASGGEVKFNGSYGASNTMVFTISYIID